MMKKRLIREDRAVVVAADVKSIVELQNLLDGTYNVKGIGAYKIGALLGLTCGLAEIVDVVEQWTARPVIYDHQKAATDIPPLGKDFAEVLASAGVKGVILFPFGGASTEKAWITACQDKGLTVLVGGHMTQEQFLESEGGFIADDAPEKMYSIAAEMGVEDFVVPGNKIEFVQIYKSLLDDKLGEGNYALFAPGFIAQGGVITDYAQAAGPVWRAIVGSAIYAARDIHKAAEEITANL